VLSCALGMLLTQTIFWLAGMPQAADPLSALLAGGFLLGLFFMVTDPISAAQTNPGRWIYGAFVGIVTVLIRTFSVWAEGTMFAILLGNMFAPIVDYLIRQKGTKK
jgi:Na+-transporting NADH:ubiquinone oxidoreductase subunit B